MKALSLVLLLGLSAGLGLYLGWRWLRQQRNNPVHSAVHLLLGVAGLECLVLLMRGAPDGVQLPAAELGTPAAILLATALMSGLAAPIIGRHGGRRPATLALIVHASLGAAGLLLAMAWLWLARP